MRNDTNTEQNVGILYYATHVTGHGTRIVEDNFSKLFCLDNDGMNMNTEITEKSLTSFIELELAECDIISALSDEPCVYRPGRRFQLKFPLHNINKHTDCGVTTEGTNIPSNN